MVYLYATAFLAVCNNMNLDVNDDNAPREFLKELYEWMYESYVCMGACMRAARAFDNKNIDWPSQPNMRYWFDGIKEIMDFTWKDEVTNWFGEVTDEHEIDLAFNMLRILDQKNFIESYRIVNDGNGDIITQRLPILNIPNMVTSDMRGYDLAFQPDDDSKSIISIIGFEEEMPFGDYNIEEEAWREAAGVPPNITVRGRSISRVLDFDDFLANLSPDINDNDEIVNDDDITDEDMPDLIMDNELEDSDDDSRFGRSSDSDTESDSETESIGSIRI